MTGSLGSFLKTSAKAARDFDVASSADVLAAAVYYIEYTQSPLSKTEARSPLSSMVSMDILNIPRHSHMFRQAHTGRLVVWYLELGLPVRRSSGLEEQLRKRCGTLLLAKSPSSTVLTTF